MTEADAPENVRKQFFDILSMTVSRKGSGIFVERFLVSQDSGGMPIYEDDSLRRTYLGAFG
jgi:hypothetical protein